MLKRNLSNWRTAKVQASSQELPVFSHMSNVTRNPIFGGLRPGRTKTGLLIDRSYKESCTFVFSNYDYTISAANNKGADQTLRMTAGLSAPVLFAYEIR